MGKIIFVVSVIIAGMTILSVVLLGWALYSRERQAEWVDSWFSPDRGIAAQVFEYRSNGYSRYEVALRDRRQIWRFSTLVATLDNSKVNECAGGVNLYWKSPTELHVNYDTAGYFELIERKYRIGGRWVTIKLRPGVSDATAPCGSMKSRS